MRCARRPTRFATPAFRRPNASAAREHPLVYASTRDLACSFVYPRHSCSPCSCCSISASSVRAAQLTAGSEVKGWPGPGAGGGSLGVEKEPRRQSQARAGASSGGVDHRFAHGRSHRPHPLGGAALTRCAAQRISKSGCCARLVRPPSYRSRCRAMGGARLTAWYRSSMLSRDQELVAVALWVERKHGANGPLYIAEQIGRLALAGDEAGVAMWCNVAERFDALSRPKIA